MNATTALRNNLLAKQSQEAAQKTNFRIKNWITPVPQIGEVEKGCYHSYNCGRYSRSCSYIKWEYAAKYTSFATVAEDKKSICYTYGFKNEITSIHKKAPKGYVFERDHNGLMLLRESDGMDYHFSAEELAAKNFITLVKNKIAENYNKRIQQKRQEKEQKRLEKIFQKDIPTTSVTFFDSRKAGNCVEGTLNFAEKRLGISREEIIKGGFLFKVSAEKLMKTGELRAIAAVKAAWQRETMVCI